MSEEKQLDHGGTPASRRTESHVESNPDQLTGDDNSAVAPARPERAPEHFGDLENPDSDFAAW